MRAGIKTVRDEGAVKIVMAIPVAPPETLKAFESTVDETVCLSAPTTFYAVGQFYDDFAQTSDAEVIALLTRSTL